MTALTFTEIASAGRNGPLVERLDWRAFLGLAQSDPDALMAHINPALLDAMEALPEGARVELVVTGWTDFLRRSHAAEIARAVQDAYRRGEIIDPDTGGPVQPWPEHAGEQRIAWGDDDSDTVVLRATKNSIPVFVLWVAIGALALLSTWAIWGWMRSADWIARYAEPKPGAPPPPKGPFDGDSCGILDWRCIWDWAKRNALPLGIGAGVLLAAPLVIGQLGAIRKAGRELRGGGT